MILSGLEDLNILLDRDKNLSARGQAEISLPDSPVKILVVPTNEEALIARDTARITSGSLQSKEKV